MVTIHDVFCLNCNDAGCQFCIDNFVDEQVCDECGEDDCICDGFIDDHDIDSEHFSC